jgi:predicted DNA-binding transcriptional regulator YafY
VARPADVGHLLLSMIPQAPRSIDATRLRRLLAQQDIERTPRAIQDTLQALRATYAIDCDDRTKPYQWQWRKGAPPYEFPPMNAHAALTLKLAYDNIRRLLPDDTQRLLKDRLRRADEVLAQALPMRSWSRKVRVFPYGLNLLEAKVDAEVLAGVCSALLGERCFEVVYRRRGHKDDERFEVHPLGLVARGPILTLVCTTGTDPGTKQLHVHRMKKVTGTGRRALRPEGFDLDTHIEGGNLQFRNGAPIRLRAAVDPMLAETLDETRLSEGQERRDRADGRVLVEATVADTLELRKWLASQGDGLEVLEPAALREAVAARARAAAALYGPTSPSPGSQRTFPARPSGPRRPRSGGSGA